MKNTLQKEQSLYTQRLKNLLDEMHEEIEHRKTSTGSKNWKLLNTYQIVDLVRKITYQLFKIDEIRAKAYKTKNVMAAKVEQTIEGENREEMLEKAGNL